MRRFFRQLLKGPSPVEEGQSLLSQGRLLEAAYLLQGEVERGETDRAILKVYCQVLCAQQRFAEALDLIRTQFNPIPLDSAILVLEGAALEGMGRTDEALLTYQRALQQDPFHTETTTRICRLLCARDKALEALQIVETTLSHCPTDLDMLFCRANVAFSLGEREMARADFQRVVQADPRHVHAMSNLAVIDFEFQNPAGAENWLRRALECEPQDLVLRMRLAQCLHRMQKFEEAFELLNALCAEHPDSAKVHLLLGDMHAAQQQVTDAANAYAQAALLDVSSPEPYLQLGKLFFEMGYYEESVKAVNKSLVIQQSPDAHQVCGLALLRSFRVEDAVEHLELALELAPGRRDAQTMLSIARGLLKDGTRGASEEYRKILKANPSEHFAHSNLLFNLSFDSQCSPQDYLEEALSFGRQLKQDVSAASINLSTRYRNSEQQPIRLGMISGDLHMHPVGYFLEALLTHLDRHRFHVYLYSNSFKEDDLTLKIKEHCNTWRNIRFLDDFEAAQQIADDQIDALFDLSGHTGKNRLGVFAIRAAPIQISWLGYWASTGVEAMDYVLADPLCLPTEDEAQYSEKVLRMPVTRLCFGQSLSKAPPPTDSPLISNGFITFGCFQSVHKIGPPVIAAWNTILKRLPTAHLKLRNLQFTDPKVQKAVRGKMQAAGLPPDRVHLLPPLSREGYLQAYADIDVCLDTFPFPGGTTTCDALWMGVPTVTRRGQNMIGRQGEAMMTAAGLSDWVAQDVDSYIEKACGAGNDPSALQQLRRGLRARVKASPLFDGSRFARDFENLIEDLIGDGARGMEILYKKD